MTNLMNTKAVRNALRYYGKLVRDDKVVINDATLKEVNKLFHVILIHMVHKQDGEAKTLKICDWSTDCIRIGHDVFDSYARDKDITALNEEFNEEGM